MSELVADYISDASDVSEEKDVVEEEGTEREGDGDGDGIEDMMILNPEVVAQLKLEEIVDDDLYQDIPQAAKGLRQRYFSPFIKTLDPVLLVGTH